jgi:RNA polymerase sigma-70 factor, ECF subfamily
MMSGRRSGLTSLFARLRSGDGDALGDIITVLYSELHALAARRMRAEARSHTLQPTALVNEAYLRLMNGGPGVINDRTHFFALAARAMRHVLVDYARQRRSAKRGGDWQRVTLELAPGRRAVDVDLLALDEALTELSTLDERAAKVVELRFFGGYSDHEVCQILDQKLPTVRRDWVFARTFLKARLVPVSR